MFPLFRRYAVLETLLIRIPMIVLGVLTVALIIASVCYIIFN